MILELVGAGGVGEVYAAYHPELDRKVAIKFLRPRKEDGQPSGHAKVRMMREAQVIAKLSHPNVVVVHDVGLHEDTIFLVMEFIDGGTVTQWLRADTRPWREVLRVFIAAGRGLAAAHAASLIHRDFKPDNVMLDKQGQVRVTDFGLARSAQPRAPVGQAPDRLTGSSQTDGGGAGLPAVAWHERENEVKAARDAGETTTLAAPDVRRSAPRPSALDMHITEDGVRLGTPAYMAPEQLLGQEIGPATDQFSFCVSIYQALYGERPFEGREERRLLDVLAGRVREPPKGTSVPGWVRKAVVKGLNADPAARHPAMSDLLASLSRPPTSWRRRVVTAALGLTVAVGLVSAGVVTRQHRADVCDGAERLGAIWSPDGVTFPVAAARRADVQRAFAGSGHAYGGTAFARVVGALDAYTGKWRAMYRETCESTHVSGVQSTEVMELRMTCLAQRASSLEALTDVLRHADHDLVDRAPFAINALPSIDGCADLVELRGIPALPSDPRVAGEVRQLQGRIAEVKALVDAGRLKEAIDIGEPLMDKARALGYTPAVATRAFELGEGFQTNPARAETYAKEALWLSMENADIGLAVRSSGALAYVVGYLRSDPERGLDWVRLGKALQSRKPSLRIELASLLNDEGTLREVQHDLAGSVETHRRSLELKRAVPAAPEWDIALSMMNLAEVMWRANRSPEALDLNDKAMAMLRESLNPDHIRVLNGVTNRAEMLNDLGRFAEAEPLARQALADFSKTLGDDGVYVSFPLLELGRALLEQGRPAAALPYLEKCYRIRVSINQDDFNIANSAFRLAQVLEQVGQHARAAALAEEAERRYRAAHDDVLAGEADHLLRRLVGSALPSARKRGGDDVKGTGTAATRLARVREHHDAANFATK